MSGSVTIVSQQRDLDATLARAGADRLAILYFTATWRVAESLLASSSSILTNGLLALVLLEL